MFDFFQIFFERIADFLDAIVFFNVLFFTPYNMPIAVFVLLIGVVYFLFSLKFMNFRFIGKSVSIFFEKEKEIDGAKAVTSRAAFVSAISGCVGMGSISGVAAALFAGGPGAVFWMLLVSFLVMPLRYAEVFLGHFFRTKEKDGTISRYGPYAYIETGLVREGYSKKLSKFLFVFYIITVLLGAVSTYILQINPLAEITGDLFLNNNKAGIFGFCFTLGVASLFIISGGLKRIIHSMEKAVSIMSLIYIVAILYILIFNFQNIPSAIALVFQEAFNIKSIYGGILGVIIIAITRGIMATEAGFGTVSFFHGKSQSDDSVREGLLSMTGPFFATFLFITLNSLAVLVTSSHLSGENGILMISKMFASIHPYFVYLLFIIAFLFAFTTIIAWHFYAEASILEVTKNKWAIIVYRGFFFALIAISGLASFGVMLRIVDTLGLTIVFPNILALVLLGGVVKRELAKYKKR